MNTNRKLVPSRTLAAYSVFISAIVGYAIYYAFTEGNNSVRIAVTIAAVLIVLPILKMPIRIYEDNDSIRIQQIIGEKRFLKQEYTINYVKTKSLFSIRLFATSVFVYWGYFWTKSMGIFYAQCIDNSNLIMLTKKSDGSKIVIDAP
jgi:hypothetical protein